MREEYHKENGKVYWNRSTLQGVDYDSFEPLGGSWGWDRNAVWLLDKKVRNADYSTFQVLNELYAKDKSHVYYLSGTIKEANPKSFEVLDAGWFKIEEGDLRPHFQGYARDCNNIYHYVLTIGKPCVVRGADLESFEVLKYGFARDCKYVYHERTRLKKCDPQSLEQLGQYFSRDAKRVYYLPTEIVGADRDSFEVVAGLCGKDAKRVYLRDEVIEGADPQTFRAEYKDIVCRDQDKIFIHGVHQPQMDAASFEFLGHGYSRDAHRVYHYHKVIEGADRDSFEVLENFNARDKRYEYYNGGRQGSNKKPFWKFW